MHLSRRAALAAATAALVAPAAASAAGFPSRPVKIIVPYPAAGPTDALARVIAAGMQAAFAQPVIVENKPGASGVIGTREAAKAEADGHTLVLSTNQTHATNHLLMKDIGYHPVTDFACIAGLADLQHVLVVSNALNVASLADLIARAKAKPGALNYGSTGPGSGSHLAMELFKVRAGIEAQHVPFRGSAPLVQEILAGRIDLAMATLPSVLSQIEARTMGAVAIASSQRAPQLPDLAMLREQGVMDAEADAWLALFAPAATPADVRGRIGTTTLEIMTRAEVRDACLRQGFALHARDSAEMTRFQASEVGKWAEVIRAANVKIDG